MNYSQSLKNVDTILENFPWRGDKFPALLPNEKFIRTYIYIFKPKNRDFFKIGYSDRPDINDRQSELDNILDGSIVYYWSVAPASRFERTILEYLDNFRELKDGNKKTENIQNLRIDQLVHIMQLCIIGQAFKMAEQQDDPRIRKLLEVVLKKPLNNDDVDSNISDAENIKKKINAAFETLGVDRRYPQAFSGNSDEEFVYYILKDTPGIYPNLAFDDTQVVMEDMAENIADIPVDNVQPNILPIILATLRF